MTWRQRLRQQRYWLYIVVTGLLVQVLINLLSSWLEKTLGETPGKALVLIIIIGAAALVLWAIFRFLDQAPAVEIVPREEKAPRFSGLVALVGPGRPDRDPMQQAAGVALAHHLAGEGPGESLRAAWLVTSRGEGGGVAVAERFRERYKGQCDVHICTVADPFDLQETYALVRHIYQEEAPQAGLGPDQVVADLTGGTAMMTAGMALACRERWPMEYVTGKPGTVSAPILVRWQPVTPQAFQGAEVLGDPAGAGKVKEG
jgi:hypothetical protein